MGRTIILVFGFACFYAGSAASDTAREAVPANCKEKQRVQVLSSADPVEGDASKLTCTVQYWVCGQHFMQTQIAPNQAGACERLTNAVRGKVGAEVCCDCFPKCSIGDATKLKAAAAPPQPAPAVKSECCGKVEQLEEQVRQLEARLKILEEKLSAEEITLNVAGSMIRLRAEKNTGGIAISSDQDISITSGRNVSIKAGANLLLKGARIQQN